MKILFLFLSLASISYAASTGDISCGSFASNNAVGTAAWTSPGNAAANDASYTSVALNASTSQYLTATNCSFSIPTGATINGITVKIERRSLDPSPTGCIDDSSVRLFKAGAATGDNKAIGTPGVDCNIANNTTVTYGGTSDLWGTTWTESDIENSGFGVGFSAVEADGENEDVQVDHITIAVEYTEASALIRSFFMFFM